MKQEQLNHFSSQQYHKAALYGDIETIQKILSSDIDKIDNRGLSALHVAILSGKTNIANELIRKGANVNLQTSANLSSFDSQDSDRAKSNFLKKNVNEWDLIMPFDKKATALHFACALGLEDVVSELLKHKSKVNQRTNGGATALHYASLFGHSRVVNELLSHTSKTHFKIKSQSIVGWFDADMTILHAAAQGGNCSVIQNVLRNGCSVQDYTKAGCGVVFFAARSKNYEAIKLLFEHGAKIESSTPRFFNDPFREVILREDLNSAEVLIKNSTQLNGITTKENGRTVYLWQPPIRNAIRYQQKKVIQLLLDAGTVSPVYDNVDEAIFFGDIEAVKHFFSKGEKPNNNNSSDYTPLSSAVNNGYLELTKFLLDNGYQENISDQDSYSDDLHTPLHMASFGLTAYTHPLENVLYKKNCLLIAKLLLKKGANPNAVNGINHVPLDSAILWGNKEMVPLLIEHGADTKLSVLYKS